MVVPQDIIAETASEIREYHRSSNLRDAAEIGRIVLTRFYAGRPELWRSHRPDKDASLRKLAQLLRGILTQSCLRRCVRIHLVSLEHPKLVHSSYLTSSHADEVYGLTRSQQEHLLTSAEQERWNVISLRQAKRRMLNESAAQAHPARGRPVSPPESKAVTRLENALAATQTAESLLDEVAALHPEAQRALLAGVTRLRACIERIAHKLDAQSATEVEALVRDADRLAKASDIVPAPNVRAVG
jgi:hypothetical protein